MTFDLGLVIANIISGLMVNAPWFILFYIGFKIIEKSISNGTERIIKEVPNWISQYTIETRNHKAKLSARNYFDNLKEKIDVKNE